MTCIVALIDDDGVIHFGSDSVGTDGHFAKIMSDPKVFQNGEFLFGYAGSFRLGQILEHGFSPPDRLENQTNKQYLCTTFMEGIKYSFKQHGFLKDNDDTGQDEIDGQFLIGYRGEIFIVQEDFSILHVLDNYLAIGAGEETATAVLYGTRDIELGPIERLHLSLEATEKYVDGVRGPFHFLSMEPLKTKAGVKVTKKTIE
jgi:hypothetical protein